MSGLLFGTRVFEPVLSFFSRNTPDAATVAIGGPPALAWAAACLMLAGFLKKRSGLRTAYTRKVFHFLIFASVAGVQGIWGSRGVCVLGAMTSLVIAYALLRGSGHFMYEAIAREKDAPRRSYYIIIPYLATLVGGLVNNIFFPSTAMAGYLVTGLGDAVAEPVGTRFGRHEYIAPALRGVRVTRSLEGSAAVFLLSLVTLSIWVFLRHPLVIGIRPLMGVAAIAAVSTAVEAASPHGWDNATLQVVPALLARAWL